MLINTCIHLISIDVGPHHDWNCTAQPDVSDSVMCHELFGGTSYIHCYWHITVHPKYLNVTIIIHIVSIDKK